MRRFVFLFTAVLFLVSLAAQAAVEEKSYFVKMGFGRTESSYIFDENLNQLPDSPRGTRTSKIDFEGQEIWLLGTEFHVYNQAADGSLALKDDDPCYTRMNHHLVMSYVSPNKPRTEPWPTIDGQRPIWAGQEFVDIYFPEGYAYKIKGGYMYPWQYHYHNKCGLPDDANVYIQMILRYDTDSTASYRDMNVFWYSAVPLAEEFCVDAGPYSEPRPYEGFNWPGSERGGQAWKVVAVFGHVHDHVDSLQFVLNGETQYSFTPQLGDIYSYHQSHGSCDSTPWGRHPGNLIIKSFDPWFPDDLILQGSDRVVARSYYTNPHPTTLDAMAILFTFYEVVP